MATDSKPSRAVFWPSLLIAAFLGGLIGAVIAGNRLAGASDFLGLKAVAFVFTTAYFGAIATGLIWLPLLAWCRVGQPRKERAGGYILIPAVFAFAVVLVPTGNALIKRGKTMHLEQQVLGALTAPKGTASPWAGIDTSLPAVGGQTCLWLLRTPSVPAWKLDELAAIFPNNHGIATEIARQTECPPRLLTALWERVPLWREKEELRPLEMAIVTHAACEETLLWRILREAAYSETRDAIVARLGPTRPEVYEEYLRVSAEDRNHSTRSLAAKDPRLSPALMTKLATDERVSVRATLAGNPALPFTLLEQLSADPDIQVRHQVILRPQARAEWREKFYREAVDSKLTDIRYAVVSEDPSISPETLARLASDESWGIRETVAKHPKTPLEIIKKLATDSDAVVRSAALARLK